MKKNQSFFKRFKFAWDGIRVAFSNEASFRIQLVMGLGAILLLLFARASSLWWGLFLLAIGGVLVTELMNTALENLIDHIHPDYHPSIKIVKDCIAGAVLIFSFVALGILIAFLFQQFNSNF